MKTAPHRCGAVRFSNRMRKPYAAFGSLMALPKSHFFNDPATTETYQITPPGNGIFSEKTLMDARKESFH